MEAGQPASYLGALESLRLDAACLIVSEALGATCWLVGSATMGREYRDVDVRVILEDVQFEALFGACPPSLSPLRCLMGASISTYLREQTGLPVDFQIQKRSAVKEADWSKPRVAMGWMTTQKDSDGNWIGPPWQKGATR